MPTDFSGVPQAKDAAKVEHKVASKIAMKSPAQGAMVCWEAFNVTIPLISRFLQLPRGLPMLPALVVRSKFPKATRFAQMASGLGLSVACGLSGAIAPALAQTLAQTPVPPPAVTPDSDVPVVERPTFVGTCRSSGAATLPVFSTTAQGEKVGEVKPFTKIVLTGIVGQGLVQIREPRLGWVRTATLLANCDAKASAATPTPTPAPTPSPAMTPKPTPTATPTGGLPSAAPKSCWIVTAKDGLAARETPGGAMQTVSGGSDGPGKDEKIFVTDPVERQTVEARQWLKVTYRSLKGSDRVGWIAEGRTDGGRNIMPCN
jgi:hypothetical protein